MLKATANNCCTVKIEVLGQKTSTGSGTLFTGSCLKECDCAKHHRILKPQSHQHLIRTCTSTCAAQVTVRRRCDMGRYPSCAAWWQLCPNRKVNLKIHGEWVKSPAIPTDSSGDLPNDVKDFMQRNPPFVEIAVVEFASPPRADAFFALVSIDERKDPLGPHPSRNGNRSSDKGFLAIFEAEYLEILDWFARDKVAWNAHKGHFFSD